ncbi:MAG: FCD domain-containing protein [Luteitalea sp.]|nr:FCD domain-containing protein [Luteitalea sp.]
MDTEDIRPESIADKVYRLLRHEIAAGQFRPGERIVEKLLVARLQISRTPIREALLRLESEGIVVCNSRRSYNVRLLTVHDVKEIYETLGILEGAAVRQIASVIDDRDLGALRRLNAKMRAAAKQGDLQAFGAWNREFHDVLLSKLENRTLREVCDIVRDRLYTFPVRRHSIPEWLRKSVREHREIIRLAIAKDGEALGAYFRDIHWSYDRNRRYIDDAFDASGEAAVHL